MTINKVNYSTTTPLSISKDTMRQTGVQQGAIREGSVANNLNKNTAKQNTARQNVVNGKKTNSLDNTDIAKDSILSPYNLKESKNQISRHSHDFDNKKVLNKTESQVVNNLPTHKNLNVETPVRLSFQLMTRAEPVTMVIETIKSLLAIKAADDEILIVDNNHTKQELYEPLAKFCNDLDAKLKVHFYHIDAVEGFKAGALNLALGLMDPNATHIVVVDSDYQALPQARTAIATAIRRYPSHTLLQFPQFYRDAGRVDVHSELNHYFNYHLYRPFNRQRALSTGTYAVIRRDALINLGGWSGASITEDAQMGVLMHRQGLRSQFIPEVIASGLLPTSIEDLMSQRRRWIYGNMQVLNTYFSMRPHMPKRSPSLSQTLSRPLSKPSSVIGYEFDSRRAQLTKYFTDFPSTDSAFNNHTAYSADVQSVGARFAYMRAHLSQLSAWVNFTGIFILLHISTLLIVSAALMANLDMNLSTLLAPLYVVYASYGLFLGRRLWAYLQDNAPLNQQVDHQQINSGGKPSVRRRLRAWALHLNFWELGALSWWPVLWGREKPFICTPKQAIERTQHSLHIATLVALPKLLLILNVITAVIVSPLSSLYSPLLFVCAVTVCLLKLGAANVMMTNYSYAAPSDTLPKPKTPRPHHKVATDIVTSTLTQPRTDKLKDSALQPIVKDGSFKNGLSKKDSTANF